MNKIYGPAREETVNRVLKAYEALLPGLVEAVKTANFELCARNNPGMRSFIRQPETLVDGSEKHRWIRETAMLIDAAGPGRRVADIGSFVPVCGLMLKVLGYDVTIIEKFDLYGEGFSPVARYAEKMGLNILDCDILSKSIPEGHRNCYDGALCLAVVEHLFCGPQRAFWFSAQLLKSGGVLVVDTPNGAMLGNRLHFLLRGENPELSFQDFNEAEPPYTGHINCYSPRQVKASLESAGYDVQELFTAPRKMTGSRGFKSVALERLLRLAVRVSRNRELLEWTERQLWDRDIVAVVRKRGEGS